VLVLRRFLRTYGAVLFAALVAAVFLYFGYENYRLRKMHVDLGLISANQSQRLTTTSAEERIQLSKADLFQVNGLEDSARFVPHFEQGERMGYVLFLDKDNSQLRKMHIYSGDVIIAIDGQKFEVLSQLDGIKSRLSSNRSVDISIIRDRERRTLKLRAAQ
jgi:hypothetical protein